MKSLGSEWGDPVSALLLSVCFLIMETSGPAHLAERVWKIRRLQQVWQGIEQGAGNEEHLCPVSSLLEVSPLPPLSLCSFSYLLGCQESCGQPLTPGYMRNFTSPAHQQKIISSFPCLTLCFFRFGFVAVSHSVVSDSLQPHGLQPTRLLCPWDSPGKILEWVSIPFSVEPS